MAKGGMRKPAIWEHKTLVFETFWALPDIDAELNKLGSQGWAVASVTTHYDDAYGFVYVLRRMVRG